MKKITIGLDTVLDYKNQVLSNLQMEHGKIIAEMNHQENIMKDLKDRYEKLRIEFNDKKLFGMTIMEARTFQLYLSQIENQIKAQEKKLEEVKKREEKKRREVVESKTESAAIEKLREKKKTQYDAKVKKSEELFIEEFVSNSTSTIERR